MALQYYYGPVIPLFKYLVGNAHLHFHVHEEDDLVCIDPFLQDGEEFIYSLIEILVVKIPEFQITGNAK